MELQRQAPGMGCPYSLAAVWDLQFFPVLCDDGAGRLSLQHWLLFREQVLDSLQSCGIYFGPVMSYLNSKICLSVKGFVYLSLLRLTQKMEFSPHTSRLLFHSEAPGILCSSQSNSTPSPVMAAGFSSVPTTCPVLLFSLLCKRPTGKWGRPFYTGLSLFRR